MWIREVWTKAIWSSSAFNNCRRLKSFLFGDSLFTSHHEFLYTVTFSLMYNCLSLCSYIVSSLFINVLVCQLLPNSFPLLFERTKNKQNQTICFLPRSNTEALYNKSYACASYTQGILIEGRQIASLYIWDCIINTFILPDDINLLG